VDARPAPLEAALVDGRAHISTEAVNALSTKLDLLSVAEAFDVFDQEEQSVAAALTAARVEIIQAIELVVQRLERGGRLIYVGAGTSGRLGLLDALECPPTFQTDPEQVQARLAGGTEAFLLAQEGAEDDREAGAHAVSDVTKDDVVMGIAAGGTTPFVHAALEAAQAAGAGTIFLACVPKEQAPDRAQVSIRLPTGPELLTGSTRLKAGTATKMVLNRISTIAMARLGKVHGNLMVDVNTRGNRKLVERGARIIAKISNINFNSAKELLAEAEGSVKAACVMQARSCDLTAAHEHLRQSGGRLRDAILP